jgi:hypothetical protein
MTMNTFLNEKTCKKYFHSILISNTKNLEQFKYLSKGKWISQERWLISVTISLQETDKRRTEVSGQLGQKLPETPISTNKMCAVVACACLSSSV